MNETVVALGIIQGIEEVQNLEYATSDTLLTGSNGSQLGLSGLISMLSDMVGMSGYKVTTDTHTYWVLIDSYESCCESWGYLTSEDDVAQYVGAELRGVRLTDTALKTARLEEDHPYGFDMGGIQFVDFVTDRGVFQLAVYNSHNGYYGHGIMVVKDDEVILRDTL